jgi:phage/plasmid primase-like uncharacterized protein
MNHDKEIVLKEATGMWPTILQSLTGIDSAVFNGKHQPCALCGGSDRFRFIQKHDKQFFCSQCGAHSGLNFYMELSGIDFSTAINDVGDYLNLIPVDKRELINKKTIVTNSFPNWYKFDFDLYQKIKAESVFNLSPWQRVNQLNMLDLLAWGDYTVIELLNRAGVACDYILLDVEGNKRTSNGNTIEPDGFYSVFGNNAGKHTYITINPVTAAQAASFMGVKIICCYSLENMESVLNNFYGQSIIAIVSDIKETVEADELQLPQLIFNAKTRQVGRKVWKPLEIITSKEK